MNVRSRWTGTEVQFAIKLIGLTYKGTLNPDGNTLITGEFDPGKADAYAQPEPGERRGYLGDT